MFLGLTQDAAEKRRSALAIACASSGWPARAKRLAKNTFKLLFPAAGELRFSFKFS